MKNYLLIITLLANGITWTQNSIKNDLDIVRNNMSEQENSWNNGDIPGFMKHYWKSDSLSFVGKSGLNRGWKKTLDNYLISYDNKDKMGTLYFNNLSINKIDINTIHIIGSWTLKRNGDLGNLSGYYSLIWQKKNNQWVIIADHSS